MMDFLFNPWAALFYAKRFKPESLANYKKDR